jgi:hypothetical protein
MGLRGSSTLRLLWLVIGGSTLALLARGALAAGGNFAERVDLARELESSFRHQVAEAEDYLADLWRHHNQIEPEEGTHAARRLQRARDEVDRLTALHTDAAESLLVLAADGGGTCAPSHGNGASGSGSGGRKRLAEADLEPAENPADRRGKRPLSELPRSIQAPPDGWLDKEGKVHLVHSQRARQLELELDSAWEVLDSNEYAQQQLLARDGTLLDAEGGDAEDLGEEDSTLSCTLRAVMDAVVRSSESARTLLDSVLSRAVDLQLTHLHGPAVARFYAQENPLEAFSINKSKLAEAVKKQKLAAEQAKRARNEGDGASALRGGGGRGRGRGRGREWGGRGGGWGGGGHWNGGGQWGGGGGQWSAPPQAMMQPQQQLQPPNQNGRGDRQRGACFKCGSRNHYIGDCPK